MENFLDKVFIEPFKGFLEKIAEFLPNLFTCLVLIITGLIVAVILRKVITSTLKFLKVDPVAERMGVVQALKKGGIKDPLSQLIAKLVYWVVLISFFIIGLDALKVPAVEELLEKFLLYLPNAIVALSIVVLGYLTGNFLGRAALIASVNAGLAISGLLGRFVKFTVFAIAITMALELLGIGKETVLIAFAIIFGGIVFAISLSFGLAGKKAAEKYIDQKLEEKVEEDDITHV